MTERKRFVRMDHVFEDGSIRRLDGDDAETWMSWAGEGCVRLMEEGRTPPAVDWEWIYPEKDHDRQDEA